MTIQNIFILFIKKIELLYISCYKINKMESENTSCCDFFNREYTTKDIEYMHDDYGSEVILNQIDNDGNIIKSEQILFSPINRKNHNMGFISVILESDNKSVGIVIIFKDNKTSNREFIKGNIIINNNLYEMISYKITKDNNSNEYIAECNYINN